MANLVMQKKQAEVQQVAEDLKNATAVISVDYLGLTVEEVTNLRSQLREEGIQMKVVKNTLLRLAANEADVHELDETFFGPTAIVFSEDEVVTPAKILAEFAENAEALEIKGGMIEGEFVDVDEINKLAKLPDRDGLLSMLLSAIQAPVRNTALAVKAVAEAKEEAE